MYRYFTRSQSVKSYKLSYTILRFYVSDTPHFAKLLASHPKVRKKMKRVRNEND